MKRATPLLVATVTVGAALAAVAFAHGPESKYAYYKWRPASPPYEHCAVALARITHGNHGHGFARADTYSVHFDPAFASPCSYPAEQAPGDIKARFTWLRKTNGQWAFCDNSNIQRNAGRDWKVETFRNYGRAACNKGFYRVEGLHGVRVGGQSRDNHSISPEHYFD